MRFLEALEGYTGPGADAFTSGAPTDFNIREDFSVASLEQVLHRFAQGQGANILTITCANPETFAGASEDPEKYNLLRVRMCILPTRHSTNGARSATPPRRSSTEVLWGLPFIRQCLTGIHLS